MRLPMEMRDRILNTMIDNVFRTNTIVPVAQKGRCACPRLERETTLQTAQMKALPSLLGPALQNEFFQIFFRKKRIRFRCSCELHTHLTKNDQLWRNVKHIVVHWCGTDSSRAFRLLAKCPRLESLTISISKTTFAYLSDRANLMKSFFPLAFRNTRITDTLGLDELLDIRGLQQIEVIHAHSRNHPPSGTEMDRANLSALLSSRLTQPKEVCQAVFRNSPLWLMKSRILHNPGKSEASNAAMFGPLLL